MYDERVTKFERGYIKVFFLKKCHPNNIDIHLIITGEDIYN